MAEAPEKVHFSFCRDECESRFEDQEHAAVAERATSDQAQNDRHETEFMCPCCGGDSDVDGRQNEEADSEVKASQTPLQQTGPVREKVELVKNYRSLLNLLLRENVARRWFKVVRQDLSYPVHHASQTSRRRENKRPTCGN